MVKDVDFDVVVGAESRGFIFGTPVAYAMGKSFVPGEKTGKASERDRFYGVRIGVRYRNHRAPQGFHQAGTEGRDHLMT